jgi:hypothetical protein
MATKISNAQVRAMGDEAAAKIAAAQKPVKAPKVPSVALNIPLMAAAVREMGEVNAANQSAWQHTLGVARKLRNAGYSDRKAFIKFCEERVATDANIAKMFVMVGEGNAKRYQPRGTLYAFNNAAECKRLDQVEKLMTDLAGQVNRAINLPSTFAKVINWTNKNPDKPVPANLAGAEKAGLVYKRTPKKKGEAPASNAPKPAECWGLINRALDGLKHAKVKNADKLASLVAAMAAGDERSFADLASAV